MRRLRIAVVACVALGCGEPSPRCEPPEDGSVRMPEGMLELGERDGSVFLPFADDGEATLVLGTQGGWMVLLSCELPRPLGPRECYTIEVGAELDAERLAPLTLRGFGPDADGSVPPVRVLLGFDEERLIGRALSLRVRVTTSTWVADGEVRDVLLRASDGP